MCIPMTPGMLRHAADLMEGRAAGMKIMAIPYDGAREGGLPIGPTLRSLAYYILAKLGDGWKLRLVQREQAQVRSVPDAVPATPLAPADESVLLRKVADLMDGVAKGLRIRGTPPDGVAAADMRIPIESSRLMNLLRHGWTLRLEEPAKKVPFTDAEMSRLSGRVLVWPTHDRLRTGTLEMGGKRVAQLAASLWYVCAQQLLDESVCWRDVGDDPEGAKLHPCWTVTQ